MRQKKKKKRKKEMKAIEKKCFKKKISSIRNYQFNGE